MDESIIILMSLLGQLEQQNDYDPDNIEHEKNGKELFEVQSHIHKIIAEYRSLEECQRRSKDKAESFERRYDRADAKQEVLKDIIHYALTDRN